jgi:trans-2,3-dihydro-3-hydroxyanthranilate isomerase
MQVDAFTTHPLGGNPCAIIFDCPDLIDAKMLAIAREMNLSETSFVWKGSDGNFRARYFTPAEEIPLAGHPTIATVFALVETGRLHLHFDHSTITLELRDGPIDVEIFSTNGKVDRVVMSQRKPQFLKVYEPVRVLPVFGLDPSMLLPDATIQTVSTGTPQLFIPVNGLDAVRQAMVDQQKYALFRAEGDFFSTHVFCVHGLVHGDTFARHFALLPDIIEDPFTGSATGGMAAYLWHYKLIDKPIFLAEQGHWLNRPGIASVEVVGSPDDIQTVKVGGEAVVVLKGELIID